MLTRVLSIGTFCLVLTCTSQAGTLVLGQPATPATGNCDPFGCPAFFGLGTFQEVYSSTAFSSAITIDGLAFVQAQIVHNGGVPAGGTYTLAFSYTQDAPGNLDLTDPNKNISSGSETFFSGTLPALTPANGQNLLAFTGTPFAYDPSSGNLLLTVTIAGASNAQPPLYLDQAQCGPKTFCPPGSSVVTSDAYFGGGTNGGNNSGGLVTAFDYTVPTGLAAPEPGSLLLALAGIGVIGYTSWRRNVRARSGNA